MSGIRDLLSQASPAAIEARLDRDPEVVPIDDAAADDVFETLSSATARALLAALYEEPRTASDLATAVDTSIQNVAYHLGNLEDAGLVAVVETWYSDQGTEMKVYAPTREALVLFAGDDLGRSSLLEAVSRLLGAAAVFGLLSLLVDRLLRTAVGRDPTPVAVGGGGAGGSPVVVVPPEFLFFLGGLLAVLALTCREYLRGG